MLTNQNRTDNLIKGESERSCREREGESDVKEIKSNGGGHGA